MYHFTSKTQGAFKFALVSPTGEYYTGQASSHPLTNEPSHASLYTLTGAKYRKASCSYFNNFTIQLVEV